MEEKIGKVDEVPKGMRREKVPIYILEMPGYVMEISPKEYEDIKRFLEEGRRVFHLVCHDLSCCFSWWFSPENKKREKLFVKEENGKTIVHCGCPRHPYSTAHTAHELDGIYEFELTKELFAKIKKSEKEILVIEDPVVRSLVEEDGFSAEFDEEENAWYCHKRHYYDDGYGHQITLSIDIKVKDGEIVEIWVDNFTLEQVENELDKVIEKCKLMQEKGFCIEEVVEIDDEIEKLAEESPCNDCWYLNVVKQILEYYWG
ncbi:MAG: hypothetical protein Q6363_007880 [Candidatus Njordarchaeota archaeon]